jgi:hypothetical protein
MSRTMLATGLAVFAIVASGAAAHPGKSANATVRHDLIAVYIGSEGTDAQSGLIQALHNMRALLERQAATSGKRLIVRGVSTEATVDDGIRHLGALGRFDEISAGDNWTNSAVVRYLGRDIGGARTAIPRLVLLERAVEMAPDHLAIGEEHEIARYSGAREIAAWVERGAPLPR